MLGKYCYNILVSLDQLVNTLFLGSPDETISSRVGRKYADSWMEKAINKFFWWQKDHCTDAVEPDSHHEDEVATKGDTNGSAKC